MNVLGTLALAILIPASPPQDQGPVPLDVLVQRAVERNPGLAAARHRARAAQARIAPAGALPDPVLSLALRNFPASDPGFADFMTMKTVGLSQLLPYPGKRSAAQILKLCCSVGNKGQGCAPCCASASWQSSGLAPTRCYKPETRPC